MSPEAALAALRLVHFSGAMLVWGAGVYLIALVPSALAGRTMARLATALWVTAVLLFVARLLRLPVIAASFGDGWKDALSPSMLAAISRTGIGIAWLIEAALTVLLASAQTLRRWRWATSTALAGLMLASSALVGHAAMATGAHRLVHQLNDATHLLAAGFWLGALVPLTLILRTEVGVEGIAAVRRFAAVAQIAVALALATGIVNVVLVKGGMPTDWSSAYDLVLLAKLSVVGAMLCLAAVNHGRNLPMLSAGSTSATTDLRRGALAEIALGVIAVGLVSILGLWDPS